MRIDRTHRAWAIAALVVFAASAAVYLVERRNAPEGPRGGNVVGLGFGILGFAFVIFAALLGARKRVPTWRLGRAQGWMRGHLWLGLLALPIILFHGGFHFGGTLTRVLLWLLILTVASGLFGAALQHSLPRMMTAEVPLETIYDEIAHVRRLLREEADRIVEAVCGNLGVGKPSTVEKLRAGGFTALQPVAAAALPLRTSAAGSAGASAAVAAAPESIPLSREESAPLLTFYLNELRGFLEHPGKHRLAQPSVAGGTFAGLRTLLPGRAHGALADLEEICEEACQLRRQEKLHRWLHGWLLVHIPLSLALILLGAVHAVLALRY